MQDPQTGQLKLHRNVNGDWTVNVTAQSKLKVEVEIFDQVGNGDLVTLQGNPIVGNTIVKCVVQLCFSHNRTSTKLVYSVYPIYIKSLNLKSIY